MKNNTSLIVLIFLIFAGYISCVKPYYPKLTRYINNLVVDGAITDQPGPYTVKVSRSTFIKLKPVYNPYWDCTVEISDNYGNSEILREISKGVYQTDSLGIRGIIGHKYKVKITTPTGEVYESKEEVLRKGIGLESIEAEYELHSDTAGYQFYLTTDDFLNRDSVYFYWSLESTYKFHSEYKIYFYYEGGNIIQKFPVPDSLYTCYRSQSIQRIFTSNPEEKGSYNKITHFRLNFENNYSKALSIRYCLSVNQYTVSKKQFNYWNRLQKMNENQGGLYDKVSYGIQGNIVNLTHPEVPAFGYFLVAGLSHNLLFVDGMSTNTEGCVPSSDPHEINILRRLNYLSPSLWPLYIAPSKADPKTGECISGKIVGVDINTGCADCRAEGVLQKPKWWID